MSNCYCVIKKYLITRKTCRTRKVIYFTLWYKQLHNLGTSIRCNIYRAILFICKPNVFQTLFITILPASFHTHVQHLMTWIVVYFSRWNIFKNFFFLKIIKQGEKVSLLFQSIELSVSINFTGVKIELIKNRTIRLCGTSCCLWFYNNKDVYR